MTEHTPIEYISYNGLGRTPMLWGIPYMVGLGVMCASLIGGMMLGLYIGGAGWLFALIGVPILMFIKIICTNDDRAVRMLLLEAKWALIKQISGNAKYFGGTMTIAPMGYGRRLRDVKRYFETTISG